jgi:hypothetical protein
MPGDAFDFLSPFMSAAIVTDPANREFTRYPLWTFEGKGALLTSEQYKMGSLAFLSEMTVKLNLAYVPTITATLTPPFEAARIFIDSPLVEWTTSILEVQFGYSGGNGVSSPKFEGLLLKPEVTLGTDASIVLNAQGVGGFGAQRGETGKPENNKSLQFVFDAICTKHKMTLDISEMPTSSAEYKAFTASRPSIVAGNVSDWFFMVREAAQVGCWTYLASEDGTSKLKVIPIDSANGESPTYTFRMFDYDGGVIGPKNKEFPIISITTPTSAIYLAGATQKLRLMGTDSKTRKTVTKTADDASTAMVRTDAKQTGPSGDAEGALFPADAGAPDAQAMADAAYRTAANGMGIKIEVETLGIPNLRPGQVVQVEGVGKRLNGKYAVFEVTHTLGSGGFSSRFTAISNVGQLSEKLNNMRGATNPNTQTKNDAAPEASLARTNSVVMAARSGRGAPP